MPTDTPLEFARAKLAELRAICDAATAGPWRAEPTTDGAYIVAAGPDDRVIAMRPPWSNLAVESAANGRLIAAARTALPALVLAWETELKQHTNRPRTPSWCNCGYKDPCPTVEHLARVLGWQESG